MVALLLLSHSLVVLTCALSLDSSDDSEAFGIYKNSLHTKESTQRNEATINIRQNSDDLQFTCVPQSQCELLKEYEINTIVKIIVPSELANRLALEDKNRKFHRIPLTKGFDISPHDDGTGPPNQYHVQLAHLGDFCFIQLSSGSGPAPTDIALNDHNYCFRVIPHRSLLREHQVIYIENWKGNLQLLKESIQRKLRIKTDAGSSTIIGINVAFETHAILIRELQWEKLLFLIQHIVDKLLPFLSSNDLIITLPVSNQLKHYKRATVSERVALVVHKARKQRKELRNAYELQYSTHTDSTFGGSIILATDVYNSDRDVPSEEIHLADFVISVGSLPNSHITDAIAISVKHSIKKDHVCFSKVGAFGYDDLFNVANKITKCILYAMGIHNASDLNIYITNDLNISSHTTTDNGIEFELTLEGGKCCLIQIAPNSIHHKLYKEDKDNRTANMNHHAYDEKIVLLKGSQLTVVLSPKAAIVASNVVFYVEFLGLDDATDWSSHSKIKALHYLLYSSREYVPIRSGLFYLCVSWTENGSQTTKCSDDLYFNVDFLLSKEDQDTNKMDSSGFIALQLIHLQSLYKTILETRNELNQQTQYERNVYHNLMLHQMASSSDKRHLKQLEQIYEYELDKNAETEARRRDLQNQLKLIQQRLKNDEEFEKQYAKTLKIFAKKDIKDPLKKRTELIHQISSSQQQMIRLQLEIKQKQEMLLSLQQQIDSIQIHTTN